ncbi:hypothetical protein AGABI1DRAFT_105416 [Agaricus bisporus var. burnettii JB137-S8]|uniref:AB hydrolase-1 domain-containing protein n=1 Tax=Agaricus bisporus var. burnettii (strain JB137-S8 / ATCC MYA-4627 / FGSC 10392) TaxID=597362 RepID=K5X2L1_AGABU|nr:uncharacterized protein AGABI1DRAFT_105416 [Agaricus bisporus var. burnettii JB137-S8]EKM82051.1 hypothetical protein AGABI1DRAFT_105416 [Agaricus bisporus var. burnettii JB137-S8]
MLRSRFFRPLTCRNAPITRQLHHGVQIPIELASLVASPQLPTTGSLLVLHGLFGSKRNWTSLHKAFHQALPHHSIHTLDLRNHGMSPHATPMTYTSMAEDVIHYIDSHGISDVALLGHSMGGKVAMTTALLLAAKGRNELLSHLLVSDVAPIRGALSSDFIKYINAMHEINVLPHGAVRTRSDVDTRLHLYETDLAIRQFLLTNLSVPKPLESQSKPHFKLPVEILKNAIPDLGSFPWDFSDPQRPQWKGKTLVFRGLRSNYITTDNQQAFSQFFPRVTVDTLDTGHWVHAEKPNEFKDLVVNFIRG